MVEAKLTKIGFLVPVLCNRGGPIENSKGDVVFWRWLGSGSHFYFFYFIVRKTARIRNRYNQVPHLSQDTKSESNKITINITNKS